MFRRRWPQLGNRAQFTRVAPATAASARRAPGRIAPAAGRGAGGDEGGGVIVHVKRMHRELDKRVHLGGWGSKYG
eukprot:scaffold16048_cov110-Isochrysis_galbana.AAC.1